MILHREDVWTRLFEKTIPIRNYRPRAIDNRNGSPEHGRVNVSRATVTGRRRDDQVALVPRAVRR
jgi:hypothetical protein